MEEMGRKAEMCAEVDPETAGDRDSETEADRLSAMDSEMGRAGEGARPGGSDSETRSGRQRDSEVDRPQAMPVSPRHSRRGW